MVTCLSWNRIVSKTEVIVVFIVYPIIYSAAAIMIHCFYRFQTMAGRKANAKGKLVGSHMGMLKDGNVFLQARWLKCSK